MERRRKNAGVSLGDPVMCSPTLHPSLPSVERRGALTRAQTLIPVMTEEFPWKVI